MRLRVFNGLSAAMGPIQEHTGQETGMVEA